MSSYRTAKADETFYDVLTVFDFDLVSTVSGQTPADFTVRFSRNDVATPGIVFTIQEIGTTGDYALKVAAGFPITGLWVVSVEVAYNGSTWRSEVEVRAHDIDDVYDVIIAGGSGMETTNLTVIDTLHGDIPIPDVLVHVYDATGTILVTFQRTNTSGVATILLDPGTYKIRLYKPGISSAEQTVVVVDTGGTTPQDFTIEAEAVIVAPPASPMLCRLYADFITQDGLPFHQFKLSVQNLFDPMSSSGLAVIEATRQYQTDANGHIEFDVVRGTRIRVAFITTPLTREFVVPNEPVQSLLTVFGAATDAFQVVKR